jgi:hypothetical protein
MTNNKAKSAPSSRGQRIINDILFIKRFQHTSGLSPDDLHEQLEALAFQRENLMHVFFPRQRMIQIKTFNELQSTAEITTKLGGLYTELRARAYIEHDYDTQKTTLMGEVKFDPVYLTVLLVGLFFLITWAIAGLSRTGSLPSPFILFTLGLTNIFYFRQMFIDRNDLLKTLAQTVKTSNISSARKRLAEKTIEADQYDIEDPNQQQHEIGSQETS